jgi:hypothetical protein
MHYSIRRTRCWPARAIFGTCHLTISLKINRVIRKPPIGEVCSRSRDNSQARRGTRKTCGAALDPLDPLEAAAYSPQMHVALWCSRNFSELAEEIMRRFIVPILVAAAAIYSGAYDVVLAQATVPNVAPPLQGLSSPVTSTVTNCMMSCNSQSANCQTSCVIPTPPQVPANSTFVAPQLNSTASGACLAGCTSTQLACQTNCARLSSIIGQ